MLKQKTLRRSIQIFFFILVALLTANHYLESIGRALPIIGSVSLHAICPYGGVETFFAFIQWDTLIKKIHLSSLVLTGIILLMGVFVGPVVCSYICPLGSIQEWFGRLGKKIFKKKYNHFIPKKLDKVLRYMRYLVLIITVYLTTHSLRLVFLEVDPYYALFHFWSSEAAIGGIVVLAITLLLSLFVERPWCKYACPFGALVGLTNLFSVFKIRRNAKSCISCGCCDAACPMNIKVSQKKAVRDHQCIRCGICTSDEACPVDRTVELRINQFREVK